jgi:GT2 family glycosyltransferase
MFFRRECLDALDGFDETQFMYGEDWDICYRARRAGWKVYLVPEAKIIHHENASGEKTFGIQRQARVLEANLYYQQKHFGRASRRAVAAINLMGAGIRLLPFPLLEGSRARAQIELARVAWREIWR